MKHLKTLAALSAVALMSVPVLAQDARGSGSDPRGSSSPPSGTTVSSSTTVTPATAPVAPAPSSSSTTLETTTDTLSTDSGTPAAEPLANTGGEPLLFVLGGLALMGTALVLRRQTSKSVA